MKILIDNMGCLHLERAGKMKKQLCPFSVLNPNGAPPGCGDWCPMFGEPEFTGVNSSGAYSVDCFTMTICGAGRREILFERDSFTDERT
jgi:hypothetical protein